MAIRSTYGALFLMAALTGACDADNDGLVNEGKYGTDPKVADSDGDGLLDGDEVDSYGTDPAVADSDGDGYPDGFEIERASDPLDPTSLAYKGGWPYNPEANDLEERARVGRVVAEGKFWPRMQMQDQFGDVVDFYDFANQGKPVIIDISAEWCPPCRGMAEWLEGHGDPAGMEGLSAQWPAVPDKVNNGDVIWLTIIGENNDYEDATKRTVKDWAGDFPNPNVPVLADTTREAVDFAELSAWPTLIYLNENFRVKDVGAGFEASILDEINDL